MSLKCPYRHVSYATWRLEVVRGLCLSLEAQQPQPQPQPQPHNSLTALPRANPTKWNRHYSLFRPFDRHNTEQKSSSQDEAPPDTPLRARRSKRPGSFNPYSPEGLQKLKDLLPELKVLGELMRDEHRDEEPLPHDDLYIPASPIQIQVEKAARRRGIQKEQATYKELGPLKNNPWAVMLAGPIRSCQASGARLPGGLLLDFDYVKSPVDGKTYLLPADLADLDALEAKLAKQLYKDDWRRVREDKRLARAQRENTSALNPDTNAVQSSESNPPAAKRQSALTRFLADVNIFRILTLRLTKGRKDDPQIRLTKTGEVSKLIPFEAKVPVLSAQHYMRHKKDIELATGVADSEPANILSFNLKDVQWQPDIHSRLAQIMRKRILICLTALAESLKGEPFAKASTRIVALPIPYGGKLSSETFRHLVAGTASSSEACPATNVGQGNEDTPLSHDGRPASSDQHASTTFSPQPAMSGRGFLLGHPDIHPGSSFLHLGHGNMTTLLSQPTNADTGTADNTPTRSVSSSPSLPPLPLPSHTLTPPMLTVDETYRFPIFSLHQLLANPSSSSPSGITTLDALIQANEVFRPGPGPGPTPHDDKDDYLLLVRPGPGPTQELVKEIWQLWRYLEGQPGVSLETDWGPAGEEQLNAGRQGEDEDEPSIPKDRRRRRDATDL
ncbi:hypothetical protein A1O1_08373 [Capronia coronata CBS 617.96]|uniref:Uncharacterized protein n=1 Tax=Capronia coronata CBS 617.96 TaxID=1182541 RepID=W9XTB0_9EURO|nr:uncharacterized protein A1O1_08373 [Capronia coronata CBS 617.96]EXJ80231.1 hypothetical protein A1O1_08373 [Capronia coronata CBS 617.96]